MTEQKSNNDMQIGETELRSMTSDLRDLHAQTFPQLMGELEDFGASLRRNANRVRQSASSRRTFLMGGSALAGGVLLAACSKSNGTSSQSTTGTSVPPTASSSASASGDVAGLRTNASLENLAVFAYGAALTAAPSGKFGTVPPAIAEFVTHAMKQHAEHASAFNAALSNAGSQPYTMPDPALKDAVLKAFAPIKNLPDLVKLALLLENTAAATYTKQMGEFTSAQAIGAVATIAPVERQHAAILHFVIGEYPVPDTFVPLALARPDSDAG